jgi:hypothetical protein
MAGGPRAEPCQGICQATDAGLPVRAAAVHLRRPHDPGRGLHNHIIFFLNKSSAVHVGMQMFFFFSLTRACAWQVMKQTPGLRSLLMQAEEDDGEEHFVDADRVVAAESTKPGSDSDDDSDDGAGGAAAPSNLAAGESAQVGPAKKNK